MAKKDDHKDWVFWLAIILSVIGVVAIVAVALRVFGVI
jgi:type IV secretory pathway component VirB8